MYIFYFRYLCDEMYCKYVYLINIGDSAGSVVQNRDIHIRNIIHVVNSFILQVSKYAGSVLYTNITNHA